MSKRGAAPPVCIVATYRDGRWLRWEDGQVTGSRTWLLLIPDVVERTVSAQTMPEGPSVPLKDYRTDPQSFIALCKAIDPVKLDIEGDVKWPHAPPEDANGPLPGRRFVWRPGDVKVLGAELPATGNWPVAEHPDWPTSEEKEAARRRHERPGP